jgi:hypothetical protein
MMTLFMFLLGMMPVSTKSQGNDAPKHLLAMSVGKLPTIIIFYAYSLTTCKHAAIATLKKEKL